MRCRLADKVIDVELASDIAPIADAFARCAMNDDEPAGLRLSVYVDSDYVDKVLRNMESASWHQRQGQAHIWLSTEPRHVQSLALGSTAEFEPAVAKLILDRADGLDGNLRARPGVEAISAWAASLGILPIHASGITMGGSSIILVGDSGSGKTTTALALAERGWKLVADDRCFVVNDGRVAKLASFYPTAIVTSNSLVRLASLGWCDLGCTSQGKHARRLPSCTLAPGVTELVAMVWVSPSAQCAYRPERLARREALVPWQIALAPAMQAHGPSAELVKGLADLARAIPAWRMGLDWDFDRIDDALRSLLDSVPAVA